MNEDPPLTLGDMVNSIAGNSAWGSLVLPQSLSSDIQNVWAFKGLNVTFVTSPASVQASGWMLLFGQDDLRAVVDLQPSTSPVSQGGWDFMLAVELSVEKFSHIIPSITQLDNYTFASVAVAVSTFDTNVSFPGVAVPYTVEPGFNFFGSVNLADIPHMAAISNFTGIEQATLRAVILDEENFEAHCDVEGDLSLFNVVHLTALGFFIKVVPTDAMVGVECDSLVVFDAHDQLSFHDDLYVALQGFGFDAAMTTDWVNPFGVTGLTISRCDLSLELSWALVPVAVGISGGLHVAGIGGELWCVCSWLDWEGWGVHHRGRRQRERVDSGGRLHAVRHAGPHQPGADRGRGAGRRLGHAALAGEHAAQRGL